MRMFPVTSAAPAARSNQDIAADFIDLSFRLEDGQPLNGFARFTGPLTLRLAGSVPATARHDLATLLARLATEAGIRITRTAQADAGITIEFLPRRQMQARARDAACFVAPHVGSWSEYRAARRGDLDWIDFLERDRVAIFIPYDVSPQEVRDCLNEELAQALGPLNDLYRLPDSVFNDDNINGILTGFDMLILRTTYAPELRPGMSQSAVAAALPAILARLHPQGQRPGAGISPTPRAYKDAIARALGPGGSAGGRQAAARQALAIATSAGWNDARTGYAWLTIGRLSGRDDRDQAFAAFTNAEAIFQSRGLPLYAAHADMQLAAFALANGQWEEVSRIADRALPTATAAQNASLMAGLMMMKSEALARLGQPEAAASLLLDSLGWARYGMASDDEVLSRYGSIAALAARTEKPAQ